MLKKTLYTQTAILVQDEDGKEVYAETWYLNYDLTKFEPHTYRFCLKLANTPKVSTRERRSKIKIFE